MSNKTSFNVIFEQFFLIVDNPKFLTSYSENQLALELSRYLYRSIAICGDYLYKDVSKYNKTTVVNEELTVGEFYEELNEQEIAFLARGMAIPYFEFQLQKQRHLNQMVYSRDYSVYSQANHIKEIRESLVEIKRGLQQDMVMYSLHQCPKVGGG